MCQSRKDHELSSLARGGCDGGDTTLESGDALFEDVDGRLSGVRSNYRDEDVG